MLITVVCSAVSFSAFKKHLLLFWMVTGTVYKTCLHGCQDCLQAAKAMPCPTQWQQLLVQEAAYIVPTLIILQN